MLHDGFEFLERALIEEGLINRDQLEEARSLSQEVPCALDEAIVSLGHVDGRRIALTKAQICESPFLDLTHYEVDFHNSRHLPRAVAEQYHVFPLFVLDGMVTLGTDDPLNLNALDQVRQIIKCEIDPVQCETKLPCELISRAYSLSGSSGVSDEISSLDDESSSDERTASDGGPIAAAVQTLLADAASLDASDIHINPDQHELHVRVRVDGVLQKRQGPPLSMHPKIVQRLKVMTHLDLTQTRRPQDGKFRFMHEDREIDVRVSMVPTVTGENVVMRLLNTQTSILTFSDLGMNPELIDRIDTTLKRPHGLLLVTGPTGSGKTTTLYTAVSKMNTPDRNIMTIEDPVEVRLPLIRQIQVNHEIGLTFASALRSILRQDPDVVLLGEIRDEETATIALQAALTGHFVFSTLHTNDSAGAVARLRDFGLPPFVINSALLGVLAQRLVRRVCPDCATPTQPDEMLKRHFHIEESGGFMEGRGCARCLRTGYRGRVGLYEYLQLSPDLQKTVAEGGTTDEIRRQSVREGTVLMWQNGMEKATLGLTTLSELVKTVAVCVLEDHECATHMRKSA